MAKLELSNKEKEVILETLKSALSDLRYEISNTDNYDFRQNLKGKQVILEGVITVLERAT